MRFGTNINYVNKTTDENVMCCTMELLTTWDTCAKTTSFVIITAELLYNILSFVWSGNIWHAVMYSRWQRLRNLSTVNSNRTYCIPLLPEWYNRISTYTSKIYTSCFAWNRPYFRLGHTTFKSKEVGFKIFWRFRCLSVCVCFLFSEISFYSKITNFRSLNFIN